MDSLEELQKRKAELQLRKEIKALEARERMGKTLAKFSGWMVVGPLGAVGGFMTFAGLAENPEALGLGVPLLVLAIYLRMKAPG